MTTFGEAGAEGEGSPRDVFALPLGDRWLVYAPRHRVAACLPTAETRRLRDALKEPVRAGLPGGAGRVLDALGRPGDPVPSVRQGPVTDPQFLGLIPTRGCSLACPYCDFEEGALEAGVMSPELARRAVDAYLALLGRTGRRRGEVHFFGGEPFHQPGLVRFAVDHARLEAERRGIRLHFEATTNGMMAASLARWIAQHFGAVVVSLDGPADIQDRHRPLRAGGGSASVVERTARILSEGPVELILRVCVTQSTVHRLPEIAGWMVREFVPGKVCFESLTPTRGSSALGWAPPDPWAFANAFQEAAAVLDGHGVEAVLSTAPVDGVRQGFCPVGRDALIVSPDGEVDACYLPRRARRTRGTELRLGRLGGDGFDLDPAGVRQARTLGRQRRDGCRGCFCQDSCCGGCPVQPAPSILPGGRYPRGCVLTRLVSVLVLLRRMGLGDVGVTWLTDPRAAPAAVGQASDRIDVVGGLE